MKRREALGEYIQACRDYDRAQQEYYNNNFAGQPPSLPKPPLSGWMKCRLGECTRTRDPREATEGYCKIHWHNLKSWLKVA